MNHKKKLIIGLLLVFALLLAAPVANTNYKSADASRASRLYKKRAKKVKKRLPKKIKKLLKKSYYKPSCRLDASRRKGKYLRCRLSGAIGYDGAYMMTVRVNLKNGRVHVISSDVDIKENFKVSYR